MPNIDRYLEAMQKQRAETMLLKIGGMVTMTVSGQSRPVSTKPTTAEQVHALIALSEELKPVTINLISGTTVSGRILQMDHSPAGYTLVIKEKSGKLAIIPYHAIQRIELE